MKDFISILLLVFAKMPHVEARGAYFYWITPSSFK
jgi:hypothetical protein